MNGVLYRGFVTEVEGAARSRNDLVADAMLERLAGDPDLGRVRHRLQVTSFGGSGTTALVEHLVLVGADLPRTPGGFPFKHQPHPPAVDAVPVGFRTVFPFGDPRDAVLSVFRRDIQGAHYRGMRLRRPDALAAGRLADLEAYLAGGVDELGVVDQFRAWQRGDLGFPVCFVRTDALASVWPEVRRFAGLRESAPPFRVRSRTSDWRALPTGDRERLDAIYGELAAEIAALPDVEVR